MGKTQKGYGVYIHRIERRIPKKQNFKMRVLVMVTGDSLPSFFQLFLCFCFLINL